MMRIGVDLGGTKIEGIVLGEAGQEHARLRIETPRGDAGAIVAAIAGLVRELEARAGERCFEGRAGGRGVADVAVQLRRKKAARRSGTAARRR